MNTLINLHNMVDLINFKLNWCTRLGALESLRAKNQHTMIWRKYFHVLPVYDEIALSETT